MNIKELIGNKLYLIRTKKRISTRSVANKIGVTHNTILNWEKGKTSIDIDKLNDLLNYYNINTIDFLQTIYEELNNEHI